MWGVPDRWAPAASGDAVSRVQVWSAGEFVAETDEIITGSVTEKRVSGPRSTLSLTVEPSKQWLDWLALPTVELRPSSGLSWGQSEFLCPLGVYPVLPPSLSLPVKGIGISVADRWQLILDDDFTYVQVLRKYFLDADSSWQIRRLAAAIIDQTGLGAATVYADAPALEALDQYAMLDKSRSDTLKEMADALSGEVFVDRLGTPRIQARVTQLGAPLVDGEDGTVVSVETDPSYANTYNQVGVSSTANGVSFFPAFAEITDTLNPAHRSKIRKRSLRYSSALIFTREQAFEVAASLLSQKSVSVGWNVTCIPDPSRMPGDICQVVTDVGSFLGVVEEITHPLGDGPQTVKLSAA